MLLTTAVLARRLEPTRASWLDESPPLQGTKARTIQVEPTIRAGLSSLAARIAFDDRKLATMSAPVQGRVLRVDVGLGDRVSEGTLLLTLRSLDVAEYPLISPIAGVVVEQNVIAGTEVDADRQQALVTVADLSTLWVMTNVDERDLELVHLGESARVHVPVLPGPDTLGTITYIAETIDPSTHSAVARIEIPNLDSRLRPGMLARVDIVESLRNTR